MKTIAFTQRVEIIESYGERRDCADQRISELLFCCGYVPIPLPNDIKIINRIMQTTGINGIVLTGGNSLVKYGGNAPERDKTDTFLVRYALEHNIPLYGFCRGMQSILDYFGYKLTEVDGHVGRSHDVSGDGELLNVNSYHNQGCVEMVGGELIPIMRAMDGVIEMIRHKNKPIVGTMWHPEREMPYKDFDKKMINNLFGGNK